MKASRFTSLDAVVWILTSLALISCAQSQMESVQDGSEEDSVIQFDSVSEPDVPSGEALEETPFEVESPTCSYDAEVIEMSTSGSTLDIAAGATFVHTWTVRNTGTCSWNGSVDMRQVSGDLLSASLGEVSLPAVERGEVAALSVTITVDSGAPVNTNQTAVFQLQTSDGRQFGDQPHIEISVVPNADFSASCNYSSTFVRDVTIPDGTPIVAGSTFEKVWMIRNSSSCSWDGRVQLMQIEGTSIVASPLPLSMPYTPCIDRGDR